MWFIAALIVGGGLIGLEMWVRNKNIPVTWYDRLIGAVGILLLLFAIQNYFGFIAELEPTAPGLVLLVMGLPSLILVAVAGLLVWRRKQAAG